MSKTIELNSAGIREFLRSDDVMAYCTEVGQQVLSRCGEGYELEQYVGQGRVNVAVAAVTKEAIKDNLQNNTLLKAVGG